MLIAHSSQNLFSELDAIRLRGGTRRCVSLVTTRGNFHDGHGAVMNAAKTVSDIVVVAIAPTNEKPHDNVVSASEFQDIGFAEQHEVDVLYLPPEEQLFPSGANNSMTVEPPPDSTLSSGQNLTIQLKLINAVQPDIAVWGEKNFVEYHEVRQMIKDMGIRTQIQCIPTVRHANGLAVCATNTLFNREELSLAPILYKTLQNIAHAIRNGARNFSNLEKTAKLALKNAGFETELLRVLDGDTLQSATKATTSYRILGTATMSGIPVSDSLGLNL
jgi:pantoate--beta-alanine ligase